MSASGGGSFAAILLSIPLSAVALMSVFGIPQLSQIISSQGNDDGIDRGGERSRGSRHRPKSTADLDDESFEEFDEFDEESDAPLADEERERKAPRKGLGSLRGARALRDSAASGDDVKILAQGPDSETELSDDESLPARGKGSRNPFKADTADLDEPADETPPAAFPAKSQSFESAVRKLAPLGVDHYHLEPGLDPGTFLFVALINSKGTTGPIHRFEAEANESAAAVTDVVQQIADWRAESSGRRADGAGRQP